MCWLFELVFNICINGFDWFSQLFIALVCFSQHFIAAAWFFSICSMPSLMVHRFLSGAYKLVLHFLSMFCCIFRVADVCSMIFTGFVFNCQICQGIKLPRFKMWKFENWKLPSKHDSRNASIVGGILTVPSHCKLRAQYYFTNVLFAKKHLPWYISSKTACVQRAFQL